MAVDGKVKGPRVKAGNVMVSISINLSPPRKKNPWLAPPSDLTYLLWFFFPDSTMSVCKIANHMNLFFILKKLKTGSSSGLSDGNSGMGGVIFIIWKKWG